ncbi:MAG TPA: thioredoxin domain-containing protein [Candidatus Acidoferrum sp.]|nr:thioredoxin domain-containing protein [Candidatus Acidoferrum sp.]
MTGFPYTWRPKVAVGLGCLTVLVLALVWQPGAKAQPESRVRAHMQAAHEGLSIPVKTFGSPSAPIRLDEFSDFQCPSCRAFYEGTLRPMMADYVARGKVYLVHHDFPLPMHAHSFQAARWANAAAEIGRFEDVEAALFDNQESWAADGNIEKYVAGALSPSDFKKVQKLMAGCEPNSHSCPFDAFIEADIALGKQIPVRATPTYVISYKGQKFPAGSGAVSWDIMRQFFDSLLGQ